MRVLGIATALLLSSSLLPCFAQDPNAGPNSTQPQTVPVQPEHSPQQSEQARGQDQKRGEDVQLGRDWRTQQRDRDQMDRTGQNGRMTDHDGDRRTVGRNWRMYRDEDERYGRDSYDQDRPRRRVKICFEYESGDEFCHYHD